MKKIVLIIIMAALCLSLGTPVSASNTGLSVSVNVNGTITEIDTGMTGPCSVIAGVYTENRKMLGAGNCDVAESQPTATINMSIASLPAGYTIKLFLLDGNQKPLRSAITVEVADPSVRSIRVVVDGSVRTFNARLVEDEWYLRPADINAALGVTAAATLNGYASLRATAQTADVSYEHDGVLNAAYIWTGETYDSSSVDFDRAVSLGLVPEVLQTNTERQITANEFRSLLSAILARLEPGNVAQFEQNVTTYDKPLLRGEGFVMAYFAAICIGADTKNNDFDNTKMDGDFWNSSFYAMDELFPHVWEGPVTFSNMSVEWNNYYTAAFLWSFWHSSPNSDRQVFEYDEAAGSMRQSQMLTVREAVSAAQRIYDSYAAPPQYVPLTDTNAVNYDNTIITNELLEKSIALPILTKANMPVWKGFVLSQGGSYENTDIAGTGKDLRNIANWGFNSVRLMLTYRTLFDANAQFVNVSNLKKLDALIAAAIKYNLHIDVLTMSLPGRWTYTDFNTYETIGEFDLFTNPIRQAEANAVWALISERYKDIPSATLSFCPIWETQNYNLSSGQPVTPYTPEAVAAVYGQLVDTIKAHDPDRFIIFEPTANNTYEQFVEESDAVKATVEGKDPNALMMSNFCDMPFVYADMTAELGVNIDHVVNSTFKTSYPVTYYAAQKRINNSAPVEMSGKLVEGTKIDIYLSEVNGAGNFEITADGQKVYSESLSTAGYNVQAPLSRYYLYAKSDKHISVTLASDVDALQISYGGNWFEWSGIDVTLPTQYAVERWWYTSEYDAELNGTEPGPSLRETSTVMLSPNSYSGGRTITINEDVTYTSSEIFAQSNQQTIETWAQAISEYSPGLIVRFENAAFNGAIHDSALKYYDDMLTSFGKHGISWFSNDYFSMMHAEHFYTGVESVPYKDFLLDVDMLKLLQKHQ